VIQGPICIKDFFILFYEPVKNNVNIIKGEQNMLKKISLRSKLLLFGVAISIIPFLISLMLSYTTNNKMSRIAAEEALNLAQADLRP
jgi:hypothetical protein